MIAAALRRRWLHPDICLFFKTSTLDLTRRACSSVMHGCKHLFSRFQVCLFFVVTHRSLAHTTHTSPPPSISPSSPLFTPRGHNSSSSLTPLCLAYRGCGRGWRASERALLRRHAVAPGERGIRCHTERGIGLPGEVRKLYRISCNCNLKHLTENAIIGEDNSTQQRSSFHMHVFIASRQPPPLPLPLA